MAEDISKIGGLLMSTVIRFAKKTKNKAVLNFCKTRLKVPREVYSFSSYNKLHTFQDYGICSSF